MTPPASVFALLACAVVAVGCGPKTPDYQSIWSSSGAPTTTTEKLAPVAEYLKDNGITGQQVDPASLPDLTVSIPKPPGWSKQQNPKLPAPTEVIGKGDSFPRAVLSVFKLGGDFDAEEFIKHGLGDARLAPNFRLLDSSTADFRGFPSGMIQGSHDLDGQRVHSWFRMVIPTGSPPADQRYLVQLTLVARADQAAKQAPEIESIMNGFVVATK